METHDRPSGERPEEPITGASPEADAASSTSSPGANPGGAQAWPPPGQQHEAQAAQYGAAGAQYAAGAEQYGTGSGGPQFGPPLGGEGSQFGAAQGGDDAGAGLPKAPTWWTAQRKLAAGGVALALVLGGGIAGGAVAALIGHGTTYASPTSIQPASKRSVTGVTAIAAAVQPSVVSITVVTPMGQAEGSGVITRSDGTIMTNNHVVAEAAQGGQITVKFSDGRRTPATVIGTDPASDLAVIRASGVSALKPATFGSSDQLRVGDPVVAIGSPLGLEGSVTAGIVSALHRTLNEGSSDQQQQQIPGLPGQGLPDQGGGQPQAGATIGDAIQTDAAINPGNSGGPLVNAYGQVVGVNSAIATSGNGNGNIGVGFAIPIDMAKQVADQLIRTGRATHAYLGVTLSDATGQQQGALIAGVQNGTPAASSGLQEGDIITQVDGKTIDGADTLSAAIRGHQPGDKITLTYVRSGKQRTAKVTLASSAGA
jgi:putative serine protease PepD